jgi:hypothetical protein
MGVGFGLGIPFAVCLIIGFIITCRRFERRAQQKHHAIPQETASVTYFAPPPAIKGFDISAPQSRDGMRDEPSAPPTGIAAFFRKLRHRRKRSESEEDLRRANPHAYRIEVGGRELPVELDTIKAPVEVWSPTGREKTDLKYTDFH